MLRMRVWRALLAQMCSKLEFGGLFAWGIPNPLFYRAKGFKGLWPLQEIRKASPPSEGDATACLWREGPFWRRARWSL